MSLLALYRSALTILLVFRFLDDWGHYPDTPLCFKDFIDSYVVQLSLYYNITCCLKNYVAILAMYYIDLRLSFEVIFLN